MYSTALGDLVRVAVASTGYKSAGQAHLSLHFLPSSLGALLRLLLCLYSCSPNLLISNTMRFSLTTIATGLLIAGVNVAFATPQSSSGGLSDQQQCTFNCSISAQTASGCDINNTTCACLSPVYTTNLTTCAMSTCKLSTSDVQGLINAGCPNGSAPVTTSKPSGAELNVVRLGAAAVSALGLISYALLM
ncbi:hypothetical protein B0H16DRAFT_556266 [Mycena metata]|uniref:Extracellular membrane protein CFEM domain-containing protein n=1 Tax=Mycena metata TaxID=1033252 RepID=A0AAD7JES9_9AGAR|nr:hypothetical protein B0H16DRAFT_556266 [Mycena metata]